MNKILILVLVVLAIIGVLIGTGSLSIIGEFGEKEQCTLDSTNSCSFNMTLPEYRSVESYSLDLSFHKVAGTYSQEIQVNAIAGVGPLLEQYDSELSSSLETLYSNWYYIYRIPSDWNDIYSVKFDLSFNGWVKATRTTSEAELESSFGVITMPYTSNTILQCGESCDKTKNIIRYYRKSDGEYRFSTYNRISLGQTILDLDTGDSDYVLGTQMNGLVQEKGEFVLEDIMKAYNINDYKTELMMFALIEGYQEQKGYATFGATLPPVLKLSYAQSLRPTDVQVYVGDTLVQTIDGKRDNVTTVNLQSAVNQYCVKETSTTKCNVPITFKSSEPGIIVIEGENTKLRAQSDGQVDDSGNFITGFSIENSLDFSGHPVQAYTSVGVILLLIFGIIFFVPMGGKRK